MLPWEEGVIRWTARIAVVFYLARLAVDLGWPASPRRNHLARGLWTAGCGVFLTHVAAVFQFLHGWSHAAAWEHTRAVTYATTGWDSGFGLYLNYLFTAWWVLDVGLWWWRDDWPRWRLPYWCLQGFFAFMMFHATVTFGPRGWRYVAVAVAVGFVGLWFWRLRGQPPHAVPAAKS